MGASSAKYRLQLLGPFGLFGPTGARIDISSRKAQALLALLATSRDGVRARGWLQDMLWGARGQAEAQGSLRKELSKLRPMLDGEDGPLLGVERDRLVLDLERLETDLADPDHAGGIFLEGLRLPGEDRFEAWLQEQRAGPKAEDRADDTGQRQRPSVAVLRFEGASTAAEESALAQGVAEEVISGLSKTRLLTVSSRHSSLTFDTRGLGAREICARLGVEYIVQGVVRRIGDVALVSVVLVSGGEDKTVWSQRYDRPMGDLLAIQDQLTAAIIGTLEPALLAHEEALSQRGGSPRNTKHWDLFLRGRSYFWRATSADWAEAHNVLEAALALAPDDVPTLSHLALCHLGQVWGGASADPGASIVEAQRLALRAVTLDAMDAYAHNILGTALSLMGRFDEALAEQRRALELNPYLAAGSGELGRLLVFAGRSFEAIGHSERAIAASPNDPHLFVWFRTLALAAFIEGHYEDAARHAADACARSPHQFFLHYLLAACHAAAGNAGRARIAIQEGRRLQPAYTEEMVRLAHPFADPDHLTRYLQALRDAGWDGWRPPTEPVA